MPDENQANRTTRHGRALVVVIIIVAIIGAAVGAIAPAFIRGAERRGHRMALTPDKAVEDLRIPQFSLTNQDERPIGREVFVGHVTVLDFIFTNCPFVCPTLTQKMLYLQNELAGTGVRFVSVSVDPERDTPQRLREHAQRIGADLERWTFATGSWDEVRRLSEEGLGLGLGPDPNPANVITLADGSTMENILHTSRLVLVGPDGAVLGLYSGLEQADVDQLAQRALLASESK